MERATGADVGGVWGSSCLELAGDTLEKGDVGHSGDIKPGVSIVI